MRRVPNSFSGEGEGGRDYLWGRVGQKKEKTGRILRQALLRTRTQLCRPGRHPLGKGLWKGCSLRILPGRDSPFLPYLHQGQRLAQTLGSQQGFCSCPHPCQSHTTPPPLPAATRHQPAASAFPGRTPAPLWPESPMPPVPPGRCSELAPGYRCNLLPRNVPCSNHFFKLHKHNLCTVINYSAENDASC